MDRTQKQKVVESLQQDLAGTACVVVTHQSGLSVAEVTQLRRQVRSAGASFRVTKNRLAKRALDRHAVRAAVAAVYRPDRDRLFRATRSPPPKVVVEYANRNDKLTIIGGGLAGQQIDAAGVRELASLPSLDELRGRLIGLLQAPAARLARVLQAPAGQVARVFAAYAESQGESAPRHRSASVDCRVIEDNQE